MNDLQRLDEAGVSIWLDTLSRELLESGALRDRGPRCLRASDASRQVHRATDPRWLSTLDAIGDELVSDSLVYRYNVEASPDGVRGDEGTFSICSFWYVEALAGRAGSTRRGSRSRRC